MSPHISSVSRSLNYHLRNIGRIRRYIDTDTCNHTVRSLVISRLDYSNSLLSGITRKDMQKLQTIQNRAARLIFGASRKVHTSPLLKQLHWLPVPERIQFKTLTLIFKAFNGEAPIYIQDLLTPHSYTENTRYLRSHADEYTLVQNRTHTSHGDKAFSNSGPLLWNELPNTLRSSHNTKTFKSLLKSHLFPN